jgi:DNA ligase D-like protein (predicted polymerase)
MGCFVLRMLQGRRATMASSESEVLIAGGREVAISNPHKVLFPQPGYTKLDLARYYLAVAEGALRGAGDRPNVLVRYPNGVGAEFFYQKRAPNSRPDWVEVATLHFPSGRRAEEVVPRDAATLVWMANLACLELHPHPIRTADLDHPDELRVDLDPVPGITWEQLREVARVVHGTLDDFGLIGWPKTSGSRGIHIYVRIEQRWSFDETRRAALALAREVERRAPGLASSKWWKEERQGVFLDYNQNAKDRTVASAYSVRPTPNARVSAPVTWDELDACQPDDFTLRTMPERFAQLGDRHAAIDSQRGSLSSLLELSARQEREGQGDAPWPPHFRKQANEPARVQPSRARKRAPKPAVDGSEGASGEQSDEPKPKPTGRRKSSHPLIEIARARKKQDALDGFERWKLRHPAAAAQLQAADLLVDAMRGRYTTWTRVRVNLQHVPAELRPTQEALDPDDEP